MSETQTKPSGIVRRSAHLNRHKKHAKHMANVAARAALYQEMDGETGSGKAATWHSRLDALSAGTAT
jgi:hypothetical protein